jgi:hypothetical protein
METLQPINTNYVVPVRDAEVDTEFEVQATLFSSLRANGFDVRGEIQWSQRRENERGRVCRFDLVLYEGGRAIHIVEVKSSRVNHSGGVSNTRQARRYREFGVPVTFVYGADDAAAFLRQQIDGRKRP